MICLQQMENNMEIILFFLFGKGISIRDKYWKAYKIELLYGEGVRGDGGSLIK